MGDAWCCACRTFDTFPIPALRNRALGDVEYGTRKSFDSGKRKGGLQRAIAALSTVFEEVAKGDALAFAILGRRVADTFVLAKSSIKDRIATITQILGKYTRPYQAIGDRMEIIFPEQSVIHAACHQAIESVAEIALIQPRLKR